MIKEVFHSFDDIREVEFPRVRERKLPRIFVTYNSRRVSPKFDMVDYVLSYGGSTAEEIRLIDIKRIVSDVVITQTLGPDMAGRLRLLSAEKSSATGR